MTDNGLIAYINTNQLNVPPELKDEFVYCQKSLLDLMGVVLTYIDTKAPGQDYNQKINVLKNAISHLPNLSGINTSKSEESFAHKGNDFLKWCSGIINTKISSTSLDYLDSSDEYKKVKQTLTNSISDGISNNNNYYFAITYISIVVPSMYDPVVSGSLKTCSFQVDKKIESGILSKKYTLNIQTEIGSTDFCAPQSPEDKAALEKFIQQFKLKEISDAKNFFKIDVTL